VGALEHTGAPGLRTRERSPLVPEELALQHAFGQRTAVDRLERALRAPARLVDGARHDVLAGSALALDEDGDLGRRHLHDGRHHFLDGGRAPHDAGARLHRGGLEAMVQSGAQLFRLDGALVVVVHALVALARAHLFGLGTADDEDRHRRAVSPRALDDRQVPALGPAVVDEQRIRAFVEGREQIRGRLEGPHDPRATGGDLP
jgi:hypothetical protein